jgi:hypothetical protein
MTDTIAIYLDRRQYFFLLHELKALKSLFEVLEEINQGKTDFKTMQKMTQTLSELQNRKYKDLNKQTCEELLEKLQDYQIIDNEESNK